MLAIRCQFLNGTYQAAAPGDIRKPEWPPHPARLHAALVAAGWAIGGDAFPDEARSALEWLERLHAPALACPEEVPCRTAPGVFVPRNLTRREVGDVLSAMRAGRNLTRQSGRVARSFPTSIPGDEPIWFLWDTEEDGYGDVLDRLAREVQYLGSSRSPVCCDVTHDTPSPTLLPVPSGGRRVLRVARPGLTKALIAARGTYPHRPMASFAAYGPPAPTDPRPAVDTSPFDGLIVRALDRRFPLTILHSAALTRAFREAVLAHAGDDAPAVLHGHACNPHVAFLALANVGHTHASGQLLGVAAVIPRRADPSERRQIIKAVKAVEGLDNIGVGGRWKLYPPSKRNVRTLEPARWIGPTRRWQTVTPIILDHYPKRRSPEAIDAAIRATLQHAALPNPVAIECSPIPWQSAAVPAPAYTDDSLPDGLRLHLDVTFADPVRGPVLAGRGRYFGVGLFAPAHSRAADPSHDA